MPVSLHATSDAVFTPSIAAATIALLARSPPRLPL